jgi:two-component system, OmpR family, response regulator MtrA
MGAADERGDTRRGGRVRPRILTVEDDDRIRSGIKMALEGEGWIAVEAATAEEALECIGRAEPELILVDLMLPGMSGFDFVRTLRTRSDVPIIIVTARVDSHDVVAGLEAGADDYVRKPFVLGELLARIRASLRRSEARPAAVDGDKVLRFGRIELRTDSGTVRCDGTEVGLTKTEFHLLCEFARNDGLVLSREQLLERVWGYDYFGDARLVDAHVHRLRTKIETNPAEPNLIVTVRGFGYKLEG